MAFLGPRLRAAISPLGTRVVSVMPQLRRPITAPRCAVIPVTTNYSAAPRKSGEGIMARRLHLTDGRPWRGHVEQDGLFRPGPQ